MTDTGLWYIDSDGAQREVKGCKLTVDKAGRYWMWSEQVELNLAYKERSKEACLLSAIDSLLFHLRLKDERITKLQRIADLAHKFADAVKPDEEDD